MEEVLIARNSHDLNQEHQSEVVKSGCIKEIATEIVKHQILEGTYNIELNEDFNIFSKGMKSKKERRINLVPMEELTKVYKRAKGGKSSAHSVIGYGVLKCFLNSQKIMKIMSKLYTKVIQNRITLKR